MQDLINQLKKTIVFLGVQTSSGKIQPRATGFLLNIQGIFHLATAKHVVVDPTTGGWLDADMSVFFNLKGGGVGSRRLSSLKKMFGVEWLFHENKKIDVAIIPFGLEETDDVMTIPDNLFLTTDNLFELCDVFFLSYQPGIEITNRISPVIRQGMISLINEDKTFYIDGAAFPGNSGSPVFLKPSPIRFEKEGILIGGDQFGGKFIGIIGEYLPYREVAISLQTKRPRVVFEENTGLSRVWPVDFINGIVRSNQFQSQLDGLKGKIEAGAG
jgi:hypothetical protein